MKEVRLGTIGSGPIVHSILDTVAKTDGISCAAVYSRSEEKGRELADQYGADSVYTDLDEMMSDEDVNTIYVASPNSLHYPQTKAALEHGKNVICEKPFCSHSEEAEDVISLAKEKGLFLVDAVVTSFLPNFGLLKEKLPLIGRVRLVLCNYTQYSSRYTKLLEGEVPNIFNPEFAGGCLQDINFYNIWFNVALFGKPSAVKYYPNIFPGLADTSGIAVLEYDDFVSGCAGSKDAYGVNSAQIEGEKGCLYVRDGSNGIVDVRLITPDTDETFNLQPDPNRYTYEIERITDMFLNDDYDKAYSLLETTVDVISVMEMARGSLTS